MNECAGEKLNIDFLSRTGLMHVTVTPVEDKNSEYKLGLWVKDDAQGIGTITYIDTDYNYAALGHPITDNTTGKALNIKYGRLYNTRILSIIKGQNCTPGELQGMLFLKSLPAQMIRNIWNNRQLYCKEAFSFTYECRLQIQCPQG